VLAEGDEIGTAEFPQIATTLSRMEDSPEITMERTDAGIEFDTSPALIELVSSEAGKIQPAPQAPLMHSVSIAESHMVALLDTQGAIRALDEVEADAIRFAIAYYQGQMSEVARRLRIGRSTLYRKLDTLGLNSEPSSPENVVAK
jgi:DNA-binding NtrC family response regulator